MPSTTTLLLDQVVADLDRVLGDGSLAALPARERVKALATAGAALRRIEAVIVETVATGDAEFAHSAGCRSENELLRRALLVDSAGAARLSKVVDAVRRDVSIVSGERLPARWPALRDTLVDGAVGIAGVLAAITPIEKVAYRIGLDDRLAVDQCLADAARGPRDADLDRDADIEPAAEPDADTRATDDHATRGPAPLPEDLRLLAEALVAVLDPDGDEPSDDSARRRGITVGRLRDGLRPIAGSLTPEVAAQLELIFDALNNPKGDGPPAPGVRFVPTAGVGSADDEHGGASRDASVSSGAAASEHDPYNDDPRQVIDSRTAAQKRHDALAAALGIAARHRDMPSLGGAAPTLVVTVDAADLAAGTGRAHVPGAWGQVPVSVAAHVGCGGTMQRVILGEGRIIGISSTDRVFTVHQRRAIVARDRECLIPGCHVPASWCEIHHVTEHARGGPTHTDNGVPLCWWHHRSLGSSGWEIRMADGVPEVRGPAWWDPARRWRAPRLSLPDARPDRAARPRAG
ncbi:DUF222 domain-containing protein [Microbacterium maritypicum]